MKNGTAGAAADPDRAPHLATRLVKREPSDRVVAMGLPNPWLGDFYHHLLTLPWWAFLAGLAVVYLGFDAASPLANATASSIATEAAEIVVTVTGLDETMSQPVHARTSYLAHEVLWGRRFVDVFTQTKDGCLAVDYRRFHDTKPFRPPLPSLLT